MVADELALLRDRGHAVEQLLVTNDDIAGLSGLHLAANAVWSRRSYRLVRQRIAAFKPDVVHVHNTLPLLSPSVYYAADREGVAVVQTLHNYRMICPNALCLREGQVCEKCVGKRVKWPGVVHACYRSSRVATAVVAVKLAVHQTLGTYDRRVDRFIACTAFAKEKIAESGLNRALIAVKPNFLAKEHPAGTGAGGYALFVGRLSREKGIENLLSAWRSIPGLPPLRVVGDGPLEALVRAATAEVESISYLGRLPSEQIVEQLALARLLAFPSTSFEGMPLTLLESLRAGTPVIASRLGSMQSIIEHDQTGRHFAVNDAQDLARQVQVVMGLGEEAYLAMRRRCRETFERNYTPASNYPQLIAIYEEAIRHRALRSGAKGGE